MSEPKGLASVASRNLYLDNPDLAFLLQRLDWRALAALRPGAEPDSWETYEALLTGLGAFSAREIAPAAERMDAESPRHGPEDVAPSETQRRLLQELHQLGAIGMILPRRLGGQEVAHVVSFATLELLARGDAGFAAQYGMYAGIAQALLLWSQTEGSVEHAGGTVSRSRFDDVVRRIVEHGESGAMCLTEPHAGSDLGAITTRATLAADGSWRIHGQKVYITGAHGEHHVVLARSEDPAERPGLAGLSLFYVPRHVDAAGQRCPATHAEARRNLEIGTLERKLGQRATLVATVHYDDSRAELIGSRGGGFALIVQLLNNSRLGAAFQALGVCEAAGRAAEAHAASRVSMGKPLARHELVADMLDEMELTRRGLRAVAVDAAYAEETAFRARARLADPSLAAEDRPALERVRKWASARSRALTPIVKYVGGEEAVRHTRLAMQIHGGLGYMEESVAPRLVRDALAIPIFEGTSQIQALMAMKDVILDMTRRPAATLRSLVGTTVAGWLSPDPLRRGVARLESLSLRAHLRVVARVLLARLRRGGRGSLDPTRDLGDAFLQAERLIRLSATAAMAGCLAATAAPPERRALALRFLERHLPRAEGIALELRVRRPRLLAHIAARDEGRAP